MAEENEAPPRISVGFTCPECGCRELFLESGEVLGSQLIKGIDDTGELVFDRPAFYTDESRLYLSCGHCGYEPNADPNDGNGAIIKWLREQSGESGGKDAVEDGDS